MLRFMRAAFPSKKVIAGLGGIGLAGAFYQNYVSNDPSNFVRQFASFPVVNAQEASKVKYQEMVVSQDRVNGVFLVIHLKDHACPNSVVKALEKVQKVHIDRISPVDIRDEDSEVIMGIGFGQNFLKKVYPDYSKAGVLEYPLKERKAKSCVMPSTGGDILIHAVCTEKGKLFELVQAITAEIPESAIEKIEETYGFRYRNGRDLSGFIDGTKNPADEDERIEVAVNATTGGSYVVTQRWVHDFKTIASFSDKTMEHHIGRTKADSVLIEPMIKASHVERMVGGLNQKDHDELRMVRHSMPYGYVTGEAGLLFIGYASQPKVLDFMLDRMSGLAPDNTEDGLLQFTKPVTGAYFYVPSVNELENIFKGAPKKGWW